MKFVRLGIPIRFDWMSCRSFDSFLGRLLHSKPNDLTPPFTFPLDY